jgi:hypothetical protein
MKNQDTGKQDQNLKNNASASSVIPSTNNQSGMSRSNATFNAEDEDENMDLSADEDLEDTEDFEEGQGDSFEKGSYRTAAERESQETSKTKDATSVNSSKNASRDSNRESTQNASKSQSRSNKQ